MIDSSALFPLMCISYAVFAALIWGIYAITVKVSENKAKKKSKKK